MLANALSPDRTDRRHGRLPFTVLRRDLATATENVSALREAVAAEQARAVESGTALTAERDAARQAYVATRAHAEMLQKAVADSEARTEELDGPGRRQRRVGGLVQRGGRPCRRPPAAPARKLTPP